MTTRLGASASIVESSPGQLVLAVEKVKAGTVRRGQP